MIHYYVWNFVLEVASVALAALTIYTIVMMSGVVVAKIGKYTEAWSKDNA
jgi:hypothetical protein